MTEETKIMFVCLGNICRSPLAHAVFESLVQEAGLTNFKIESSGTTAYHVGELPDARMRATASEHGVKMTHRARQLKPSDLDHYDLILAMDNENLSNIRRLAASPEQLNKIQLFRDYDPEGGNGAEVPDPYYGGAAGFENVFQIVHRTAGHLLRTLTGQGA
ncbi:MAG: low molecular weight phosphotyrosine protein phosphatase [Deltaproteobacteria bacterium]|nr:low molecular weight phosphotyrosine protein phosphatase [Deltaproteobacteria bacterium]MBN2673126.1 low molecular weight phosphotyrosine protein phosphatase [Deltaproteobacteria bacterium]